MKRCDLKDRKRAKAKRIAARCAPAGVVPAAWVRHQLDPKRKK